MLIIDNFIIRVRERYTKRHIIRTVRFKLSVSTMLGKGFVAKAICYLLMKSNLRLERKEAGRNLTQKRRSVGTMAESFVCDRDLLFVCPCAA